MASLMISEMPFEVVLVNFSRAFFSSSLMRSEMTFCNGSALFLFFGSGAIRFLVMRRVQRKGGDYLEALHGRYLRRFDQSDRNWFSPG